MNPIKRLRDAARAAGMLTEPVLPPQASAVLLIKQRMIDTQDALDDAQREYQAATLTVELADSPEGGQRLTAAIAALKAAQQRQVDLQTALAAAQAEDERQAQEAAAADIARSWKTIDGHVADRAKAAVDFDASLSGLADAYRRLLDASTGIHAATTGAGTKTRHQRIKIDEDACLVRGNDIEAVARLALLKEGFKWAIPWLGDVTKLPSVTTKIERANAEFARFRK